MATSGNDEFFTIDDYTGHLLPTGNYFHKATCLVVEITDDKEKTRKYYCPKPDGFRYEFPRKQDVYTEPTYAKDDPRKVHHTEIKAIRYLLSLPPLKDHQKYEVKFTLNYSPCKDCANSIKEFFQLNDKYFKLHSIKFCACYTDFDDAIKQFEGSDLLDALEPFTPETWIDLLFEIYKSSNNGNILYKGKDRTPDKVKIKINKIKPDWQSRMKEALEALGYDTKTVSYQNEKKEVVSVGRVDDKFLSPRNERTEDTIKRVSAAIEEERRLARERRARDQASIDEMTSKFKQQKLK